MYVIQCKFTCGARYKLISLAMAEAIKLFTKSGGAASGNEHAVSGASTTVIKLLVQSKFSSARPDWVAS